ncbi:MAG: YlxR family protein [Lachnospiraceae bacterium]|nr:YlxR family protein [Lachnospiraceae bacterium]
MNQKKIPMRKCIGCGNMLPKKELIRVVHTPEDEFYIDITGTRNGRGAYLCANIECLEKALKTKAINRSFSANVPEEIGEKLKKELSDSV